MLAASDGASEVAFAYDALNRVAVTTQTVAGRPYAITYTYDASGNRTGMGTPWGAYSYTYDALNRVTDIVNPQGTRINFKYDAAGRRQAKSIYRAGAAVPLNATAYAYDAAGQVTGIVSRAGGVEVAFASYTYNAGGNRVLMTDHDGRHLYGYDKAGRLTDVENYGAPGETFAYDAAGNRASDDRAADYVYDAANRVQTNSLYAYTHDANGNLISRIEKASNAQTTYTYDAWQHLTQAVTPAHKLQYSYDALGRRTTRMVDGATVYYVYDGDDIIAELDADGKLINVYTNGPGIDEPLVMTKPGTGSFYYHADALGSIKAITDDNNVQVETYRYKAYGEPALTNALGQALERSCIGNLRMYTAREYEPETGVYDNRHRYWDPVRGSFIQEDPIGFYSNNTNLYSYAGNNSINLTDPTGLWSLSFDIFPFAWGFGATYGRNANGTDWVKIRVGVGEGGGVFWDPTEQGPIRISPTALHGNIDWYTTIGGQVGSLGGQISTELGAHLESDGCTSLKVSSHAENPKSVGVASGWGARTTVSTGIQITGY